MRTISDVGMLVTNKKNIVVSDEVKKGYISKEKIESMIIKMKKHIPFFYHEVKTDIELEVVIADWFRYIKKYRESDCYQVYDMFMQLDDKCSLREFLATIKRVAHRNAIEREQQERESKYLQIGQLATTKEDAKANLNKIKKQILGA